jgi:hypothetical protein
MAQMNLIPILFPEQALGHRTLGPPGLQKFADMQDINSAEPIIRKYLNNL